jgi:phosphotriesterase-related protein
MVATARGELSAGELGVTLMHEHLFVLDAEVRANYPEEWHDEVEIAHAVERLAQAYARGVRTVVDVTVLGLGRFVPRIIEVAQRTPVNIVVATGLYTYDLVPLGFRSDRDRNGDIDLMAQRFARDIEEGISTTGVRAGALKCSSDRHGITPGVERAIRAVARAHRATEVPIMTHTNVRLDPGGGLRQIELLSDEGVALDRVVIGHSDDSPDYRYLLEIAQAGAFVGFDHLNPIVVSPTIDERVDMLVRLMEAGFEDRLILSHDAWCFAESYGHTTDFNLIHDVVVPLLRARGLGDEHFHRLLVENPRHLFAGDHSDAT